MNPSTPTIDKEPASDKDLQEKARPGYGVPSQDPRPQAQLPMDAEHAEREAASVFVGGGVLAGAAAGAAVGVAVAGPVGVVVGGTVGAVAGAVAGAVGGAAAGALATESGPAAPVSDLRAGASAAPRLHIEDLGGDGRAVVLIHGWPLSADAWAPQMPALVQAGYRVVRYDRRGFGRSDKPPSGYGYDELADDLVRVIATCGLRDATLVGFSMGGGEVARYMARHGGSLLHSVVLAAAVPPYLMKTADNPEGPLPEGEAKAMKLALEQDREAFFDRFTKDFFSAHGALMVSETQRQAAIAQCRQSAPHAALACMEAFATTDFRDDLKTFELPTLVIHGDADAIVPIEGSGERTHRAIAHSELEVVRGAPHGLNVSHRDAFNQALLSFLQR